MKAIGKRFASLPRLEAHEVCNPHFKVSNPIVPGLGDFEKIPLRSFYGVAAATAVVLQTLFTVIAGVAFTQGGLNFIQTRLHTSQTKQSELPNPRKHLVRSVVCFLDNRMNQVDVVRFLSETICRLVIGSKTYLEDILGQIAGGGGAWMQSTFGSASVAGNGWPSSANEYSLLAPQSADYGQSAGFPPLDGIVIEQGQNFSVVLDPTQATQYNALGVGFTTAVAAATPAGIGVMAYLHLRGTQLIEVQ